MRILFATARFPYPPLRGDQLIPYFRICQLAERHEITLLSFIEHDQDLSSVGHLRPYCKGIETVRLPPWRSYLNMAASAGGALPFQAAYYHSTAYRDALFQLVRKHPFDILHVTLSRVAHHAWELNEIPRVCEMIDALSLNMQRRAAASRGPAKWVFDIEAKRMGRFELNVCREFDRVLVVSEADRAHLGMPNVSVVPAGVDIESRVRPPRNGTRTVIFTGNLDYYPNRDAALFILRDIWPQLRRAVPQVRLQIVGNKPGAAVIRLAQKYPDVEVTGFVRDLGLKLLEADVAICPLRLGGAGMHRKVVEAMACGTPVVISPLVTGLDGRPGQEFLVARDSDEYVQCIRALLQNQEFAERLAANGRKLVAEKYSWKGTTSHLESIYREVREQHRHMQDTLQTGTPGLASRRGPGLEHANRI